MKQPVEELIVPKITVDGKEIDLSAQPEFTNYLKDLTKTIATQEKTKLYTKFEELKAEVKALPNVQPNVEPQVQTPDFSALKTEIIEEVRTLLKPLSDKTEAITVTQVEAYRNKLIMENQDSIIPEIVKGSTIEELDIALAASKELFGKYAAKNGTPPVVEPIVTPQAVVTPVVEPIVEISVPNTPPANPPTTDVSKISMDEYAKNRSRLLAELDNVILN